MGLSSRKLRTMLATVVAATLALASCQDATQMTVSVRTNVSYRSNVSMALWSTVGGVIGPGVEPQSTFGDAWLQDGALGDLVITPNARKDETVTLRVVLGVGRDPKSCSDADPKGCVVARRRLAFVPHARLRIPVVLHLACTGVVCADDATCNYLGQCVPAAVDPAACGSGDGCTLAGDETVSSVADDCSGAVNCANNACAGKPCSTTGSVCAAGVCACPLGSVENAQDLCTDGKDNDCDGKIDCADTDCDGRTCAADGSLCGLGACQKPSCTDKTKNGAETDVDCGGACGPCRAHQTCKLDSECQGARCNGGRCTEFPTVLENPTRLALGDFDRDGKLDIVVGHNQPIGAPVVGVLLNNGSGGFGAEVTYAANDRDTQAVAVADFNNDGKLDLVSTVYGADYAGTLIDVFPGNGDGTFAQRISIGGSDANPFGIAVADMDKDGQPDILTVANNGGWGVNVLRQTAPFAFSQISRTTGMQNPQYMAIADLNGDTWPDVVVGTVYSGLNVLFNNKNGTLGNRASYLGGCRQSVAAGDVDGDGDQDIAVAQCGGPSTTVTILKNDGTGIFTPATPVTTGKGPTEVRLVDLDQDGKLDLLVTAQEDDTVEFLRGNGDGTFAARTSWRVCKQPIGLAAGDVDADGRPDVVVACLGATRLAVLLRPAMP